MLASQFVPKPEPPQARPDIQYQLDTEYDTGRIHPKNNKPIYLKIMEDTDGASMDLNDAPKNITGYLPSVEFAYIPRMSLFRSDNVTETASSNYDSTDASEFRVWTSGNGTEYNRRLPNNNDKWRPNGTTVRFLVYFEYTKTTDQGVS